MENTIKNRCLDGFATSLFLSLVLLVIQGCGSASKINSVFPLSKTTVLSKNEGIVVARFINASGMQLPFNKLTLTPKNINESKNIKWQVLRSKQTLLNETAIFSSAIRSGDYSLEGFGSYYHNDGSYYVQSVTAGIILGTFTVKANQVTDLGTIIFYAKPQEDKFYPIFMRLPEPELAEVIEKYFPFFQYDKNNILTWDVTDLEDENRSDYLSIVQNPTSFEKIFRSHDNSIYFLGKLGAIVRRSNIGDWELDVLDTNLNLNAIAENKLGDLMVGGSEGRLFLKRNGSQWQDISMSADHQILDISFFQNNILTIIAKTQEAELVVLRASIDGKEPSWSQINKYHTITGWENIDFPSPAKTVLKNRKTRRIYSASISTIGDKNYVWIATQSLKVSSFSNEIEYSSYSFDSRTWKVSKVKYDLDIRTTINSGPITLGIEVIDFWSKGRDESYHKYLENSDSWERIRNRITRCRNGQLIHEHGCETAKSTPIQRKEQRQQSEKIYFNFISKPWFKNYNDAIAIAKINFYKKPKTIIIATKDGGNTWYDTGNKIPNPNCTEIVTDISGYLLVSCNGISGDFYESKDDGATWKNVRQQENF